MATRSTIAMEQPDGRIMQIYCHWDGYLGYNGQVLHKYYRDRAGVLALMLLGDLSTLGKHLSANEESLNIPGERHCEAFGRDRGESDTHARVYAEFQDYCARAQMEEYNYIFRSDDTWYVSSHSTDGDFTTLSIELEKPVDTAE